MSEEKRLTFAGYGYVVFVRIDRPKRRFSVIDNVILLHSACPVRDTLVFPSFGCFGRKRFEYASSGRVFLENGEFKLKTSRYVKPRTQGFSLKKEKALGTRLRYVRTKAKQKGKQIACEHPPSPLRKHPKRGSSDFSEGGVGGAVHRLVNK